MRSTSAAAFSSEPFNVPFPIGRGAAALLFAGARAFSVDRSVLKRFTWSTRLIVGLLVLAVVAAALTWVVLYGVIRSTSRRRRRDGYSPVDRGSYRSVELPQFCET